MAMGERANTHVLTGKAHAVAGINQGAVGHDLRVAPVHGPLAPSHFVALAHGLGHLALQLEAIRQPGQALGDVDEALLGHPGVSGCGPTMAQERTPVHEQALVRFMDNGERHVAAALQGVAVLLHHLVGLGGTDHVLFDQLFDVALTGGRQGADAGVHQRLGLHRLLGLVMPPAAVADDVDHHILAEAHAVVGGQLGDEHHRLGVVAVDVEDGRLDDLGDLGAVLRRTGVIAAVGGEADLVVDDDVDRAAGLEAPGLGHLEGFHDHPLAGKGGIAVDQYGGHEVAGVVASPVLAGTHGTLDHRADDFQVGGVEGQGQVHFPARGHDVGRKALMVLDVPRAGGGGHLAVEFIEQVPGILAEYVDQHVQAATVGHADDALQHAVSAQPLQQFVQAGNQGLAALQAKPLGAGVPAVQVLLKAFGSRQPLQYGAFLRRA